MQARAVEINLVDDEVCVTIDGSLADIENAYPGYQWIQESIVLNNNDLQKEYELYFDFLNETFLSDYLDGKIFVESGSVIREYSLDEVKEGIRLAISSQEKISLKASFVLAGQEMKNKTQNLVGELTYRFILTDQILSDNDSKKEKNQLQLLPRTSEKGNQLGFWGRVLSISSCCLLWWKKTRLDFWRIAK